MNGAPLTGDYWEGRGLVLLWVSLLSAPVAWALDQLISYALIKPVCFADARLTLTVISVVALLLVTFGGILGGVCLAQATGGTDEGGRTIDRSYFMAIIGIAFNVIVGLLIVFATIPQFILSPCE